jgi:flagellar basal-body rod protein FlgB
MDRRHHEQYGGQRADPEHLAGRPPVNDVTMTALHSMLRGLSARQTAIADNIANVETPGYTAKAVDFETSLREALSSGDTADVTPTTSLTSDQALPNGNNVQIGQEMVNLTDTNLKYETAIQAMTAKFGILRTSISGQP